MVLTCPSHSNPADGVSRLSCDLPFHLVRNKPLLSGRVAGASWIRGERFGRLRMTPQLLEEKELSAQ